MIPDGRLSGGLFRGEVAQGRGGKKLATIHGVGGLMVARESQGVRGRAVHGYRCGKTPVCP